MASGTGDRAPGAVAAGLCVAGLIALVYAGPILSGERFYFRDVSQNHGPVFEAARHQLAAGEAPWWNPSAGGGEPLFANPNHVLFLPYGLVGLLFGQGLGLTLAALAGSLLAGLFLFLLLRDLGRSPWAAATGALAFALSGYGLSIGSLPNVMAAVSWIPASLVFMRRARGDARWLLPAVVATALVLAPCEPASALVLAVFALALAGRTAVGALALGLAAAAVQVLPAAMWIGASARAQVGLAPGDASKWALVLRRLPEIVLPGFLGRPESPAQYWGANLFQTGLPFLVSIHVGGAVLLLALLGIRGAPGGASAVRARLETRIAIAGSGFFLLALVATPAHLAGIVPGAALFRYPEKFVLGALLAIAVLTASGVERLAAEVRKRAEPVVSSSGARSWIRSERFALAASAGLLLVVLALCVLSPSWKSGWFLLPDDRPIAPLLRSPFGLGMLELVVFLSALVLAGMRERRAFAPLIAVSVAAGLLLGALVAGPGPVPWRLRANPSVPGTFYASRPFFDERLEAARGAGERVFRFDRPEGFAVLNRTGTFADGHQWDRRSLGRSSASEFGVELAYDRSTDRLDPPGQDAALAFFTQRRIEDQVRFWSLASVRYVYAYRPLDAPGLRLVDRVEGESNTPLLLYENDRCLPRVRMTSTLRSYPASSDEEARGRIVSGEGDAWQEPQIAPPEGVHVPPGALVRTHASGQLPSVDTGRRAAIVERGPGHLKIHVDATPDAASPPGGPGHRPENLVIAENDVPGWRATLDGAPVRIARTNGMHMSVLVPDVGSHEIVLSYSPPGLLAGTGISVLAVALALARSLRREGSRSKESGSAPVHENVRERRAARSGARAGEGALKAP